VQTYAQVKIEQIDQNETWLHCQTVGRCWRQSSKSARRSSQTNTLNDGTWSNRSIDRYELYHSKPLMKGYRGVPSGGPKMIGKHQTEQFTWRETVCDSSDRVIGLLYIHSRPCNNQMVESFDMVSEDFVDGSWHDQSWLTCYRYLVNFGNWPVIRDRAAISVWPNWPVQIEWL
jgi:hypothetical protein